MYRPTWYSLLCGYMWTYPPPPPFSTPPCGLDEIISYQQVNLIQCIQFTIDIITEQCITYLVHLGFIDGCWMVGCVYIHTNFILLLTRHFLSQLTVLGTPAEEGEGGKIDFIRNNVFSDQGIDAAVMAHPWTNDHVTASGFLCRER